MRLTVVRRTTAGCPAGAAGFTLVELVVAIAILGVLMLPLAGAIIGWLRNADATTQRMALSHDSQISAAYFARDVAAVGTRDHAIPGSPFRQSIQLDAAFDAGGHTCGSATTPAATVRFLADAWDTSGSAPAVATDVVAYVLVPAAGGVAELHRIACRGSAAPTSDVTLAHHVDPGTVSVTCSSACEAASVPQHVSLAFSVRSPGGDAYEIRLNGQRRQT